MEKVGNNENQVSNTFVLSNTASNKEYQNTHRYFKITERFVLTSPLPLERFYKAYRGIDLLNSKYVTIYLKPSSKEKMFARSLTEELRQRIAPPVKWSGTQTIDKNPFDIEVHASYGPSLYEIMVRYKKKINEKTFFLLAYHLLKLIEKIDKSDFILRSLSLKNVILSESYHRNELYLMNIFDLQRKNEENCPSYDMRYCSVGAHLKLKTSSKDTLQSFCYLLMDFYKRGSLFANVKNNHQKQYFKLKTTLNPQGIPIMFLEFFQYVKNLNHGEQIKFTEWIIRFKKSIPEEDFHRPYEWVSMTKQSSILSQNKSRKQKATIIFSQSQIQNFSAQELNNGKMESLIMDQDESYIFLQQQQDLSEFQEGQTNPCEKINDKLVSTLTFNIFNQQKY